MHHSSVDKSDYAVKSAQHAAVAANTTTSGTLNIADNNQKNTQGNKTNKRTRKRKNNNSRGTNQHKSARLSPPITNHRQQQQQHHNDEKYLDQEQKQQHHNYKPSSDLFSKSSAKDMQASNIIKAPPLATKGSPRNDLNKGRLDNSATRDQNDTSFVFNHLIESVTSNSDQFFIDEMLQNNQPLISFGATPIKDDDSEESSHQHNDSSTKNDPNKQHDVSITQQQQETNKSISQILNDEPANVSKSTKDYEQPQETDHDLIDRNRDVQSPDTATNIMLEALHNETREKSSDTFNAPVPDFEESQITKERTDSSTTPEPTLIDKEWLSANIGAHTQPESSNDSKESTELLKEYNEDETHVSLKDGNETRETSSESTAIISEGSDAVVVDSRPPEEVLAELTARQIDLPKTVVKLETREGSPVYLIGTSHFSKKSIQDVVSVMQMIRPAAVVLELCREREMMLQLDEERLLSECGQEFSLVNFRTASKRAGAVQGTIFILFLRLSAMLTKKLGMAPGGEFRAAARQASEIPGCRLYFGDRSLKVTISRAVNSLSFWQKIKFVYIAITADMSKMTQDELENFKDKDVLEELLKELATDFPAFKQVLLDERNAYLAHNIYSAASAQSLHKATVAVVGIGHLQGIVSNWGKTTESEIQSLENVPEKSRTSVLIRMGLKYTLWGAVAYAGYRLICPSQIQNHVSRGLWNVFSQVTKLGRNPAQGHTIISAQ